jgi:hypothetical protein
LCLKNVLPFYFKDCNRKKYIAILYGSIFRNNKIKNVSLKTGMDGSLKNVKMVD